MVDIASIDFSENNDEMGKKVILRQPSRRSLSGY